MDTEWLVWGTVHKYIEFVNVYSYLSKVYLQEHVLHDFHFFVSNQDYEHFS